MDFPIELTVRFPKFFTLHTRCTVFPTSPVKFDCIEVSKWGPVPGVGHSSRKSVRKFRKHDAIPPGSKSDLTINTNPSERTIIKNSRLHGEQIVICSEEWIPDEIGSILYSVLLFVTCYFSFLNMVDWQEKRCHKFSIPFLTRSHQIAKRNNCMLYNFFIARLRIFRALEVSVHLECPEHLPTLERPLDSRNALGGNSGIRPLMFASHRRSYVASTSRIVALCQLCTWKFAWQYANGPI